MFFKTSIQLSSLVVLGRMLLSKPVWVILSANPLPPEVPNWERVPRDTSPRAEKAPVLRVRFNLRRKCIDPFEFGFSGSVHPVHSIETKQTGSAQIRNVIDLHTRNAHR